MLSILLPMFRIRNKDPDLQIRGIAARLLKHFSAFISKYVPVCYINIELDHLKVGCEPAKLYRSHRWDHFPDLDLQVLNLNRDLAK